METPLAMARDVRADMAYAGAIGDMYDRTEKERPEGDTDQALDDRRQDLEFLISIDYRLGKDFPPERLRLMLVAHRTMREEMRRSSGGFLNGIFSGRKHAKRVQILIEKLMTVFQSILTTAEYEAFTGLKPNEKAPQVVDLSILNRSSDAIHA